MNYEETIKFMTPAPGPIILGLVPIQNLVEELGHPELGQRFIHIAGTNGKGSILSYVSTALTHAGFKVGRYLSPTLYTYEERFQIDGVEISREELVHYADILAEAVKRMDKKGMPKPSAFELETALCLLYFRDQKCDYVVFECGMGGETDATNVIPAPEAAVFASISMDHMGYLGNTTAEIASVKAGILKKGTRAVSDAQKPDVAEVLSARCESLGIPITYADLSSVQVLEDTLEGQRFLYKGVEISVSLPGSVQVENAATAYEVLKVLQEKEPALTDTMILEGLKKASWRGRFTKISSEPDFYVDGAHNPDAAMKLRTSMEHYFQGKRLIFIMGVFADKDYEEIIRITTPLADEILTVQTPGSARALPAEELAEKIRGFREDVQVTACSSIAEAVECAHRIADKEDVIISFGSLSFIGVITQTVDEYKKK